MSFLRAACGQINPTVGDLQGNVRLILDVMAWAEAERADVLLLPELAVTGYPPEDLLLREQFVADNVAAVEKLAAASGETAVVVGFVQPVDEDHDPDDSVPRSVANAAAVLAGGEIKGVFRKCLLPNYGVFDEARYFVPGRRPAEVWEIAGFPVGISVCEDIWSHAGPPGQQAEAGAAVLLNINGSPYHQGKGTERAALLSNEAVRSGVPVVYLNMVGGQDELVFDGDSMVFAADGSCLYRAAQFAEERFIVDVPLPEPLVPSIAVTVTRTRRTSAELPRLSPEPAPRLSDVAEVYAALVAGLRDYVSKNGFSEVVIGLSGGIDSALTAAIAVDALGPEAVWGVTMPARFSSEGSWKDSEDLAQRLGCRFDAIAIDSIFGQFLDALQPVFAGTPSGVAEENLQARIRGAVLMAMSNKFGGMVVATGNKSEMAVGYATLYGDMAGGYAVLKDVFKTLVYRLAEWRNRSGEVIPRRIIDKPPSAELRPDQKDTDSLPDYDVLDEVLRRYVELDMSVAEIVASGLDAALVGRVARMVDRNEYKRRQAAPGVRITRKAFGKDRRLPITNGYDPRRS
ncbi:MAG TPA: NAD+ synthase [Acidimicrobiia bacterium]|jgi:NAD+ synthase (glutamine-hydrolysing)|nr:NAD+ synthase [Acidimicrobiia bacterium]